ncbi:transposase [Streptomyces sp. NPDC005017]|uniref:transposase n=1 Tax=Streptomyces sp. NPDC005017 TaxID=3364706 RepID=UPI0036C3E7C0
MVGDVVVDNGMMTFSARTATRQAVCPGCGTVSSRVRGGYRRRPADVAVAEHRAVTDLLVRRCIGLLKSALAGPSSSRSTGSPSVSPAHGVASPDSGEDRAGPRRRPGSRLAAHLSIPTSPNSLLRLLRGLPDEPVGTAPRLLGIDDFAFRKGHAYGTIILDVETGTRVDVLPDHTSETLSTWLRDHPGAETVCRDGASAYAEAVRTVCPDTTQVADRFHLWKNLCEAVEKCVAQHRECLTDPAEGTTTDTAVMEAGAAAEDAVHRWEAGRWRAGRRSGQNGNGMQPSDWRRRGGRDRSGQRPRPQPPGPGPGATAPSQPWKGVDRPVVEEALRR